MPATPSPSLTTIVQQPEGNYEKRLAQICQVDRYSCQSSPSLIIRIPLHVWFIIINLVFPSDQKPFCTRLKQPKKELKPIH